MAITFQLFYVSNIFSSGLINSIIIFFLFNSTTIYGLRYIGSGQDIWVKSI